MKCASCDTNVFPTIKAGYTWLSLALLVLILYFFQLWSVLILPFAMPLSKSIFFHCPQCSSIVGKNSLLGLNSLSDKVMTIKIGDFALIFSRKYLIIFSVLAYLAVLFLMQSPSHSLVLSPITWAEYLSDCSAEHIIKDKPQVEAVFYQKYYGKVVGWEGYFMKAKMTEGWFQGEHAATVLVKMQPTESEAYADLFLTLNSEDLAQCKATIATLDRGDRFAFNASLMAVADEEAIHHLHAHEIRKLDGRIEIPNAFGTISRYAGGRNNVEIVSIVDKPVKTEHDHVHYYNDTYNSTLE
jgi:hypothetical protein